jgi:hypothetical protein
MTHPGAWSQCVQAGFPSPAADFAAKCIDVMDRMVVHPQATYSMRVSGEAVRELGIFEECWAISSVCSKKSKSAAVNARGVGKAGSGIRLRTGQTRYKTRAATLAEAAGPGVRTGVRCRRAG